MNHDIKTQFWPQRRIIWKIYYINKMRSFLENGNAMYDVLYIYFLDFNYPCYALFMSHIAVVYKWRMKHTEVQYGIYTLKIRCHFVIVMGHTMLSERRHPEEVSKQNYQKLQWEAETKIRSTLIIITNLWRLCLFTEMNQYATWFLFH